MIASNRWVKIASDFFSTVCKTALAGLVWSEDRPEVPFSWKWKKQFG